MPKNTAERIIDKRSNGGSYTFLSSSGGGGGISSHHLLTDLAAYDDHPQYLNNARGDAKYVPLARQILTSNGITGGGALSGDLSLALATGLAGSGLAWGGAGVLKVGAGLGITVNADDVALASSVAGNGLSYSSGVLAVGVSGLGLSVNTTQVVLTSSSNPGAAAAILASDSSGSLTVQGLQVGPKTYLSNTNNVSSGGPDVSFSGNMLMTAINAMYWSIDSGGTVPTSVFSWRYGGNTTSTSTEIMRLTEAGYLKVGAAGAPSYPLDVAGSGRFTGTVYVPTVSTLTGDLTISPASDIRLSPVDSVILLDGKALNGSSGFSSGFAGSGFELVTSGGHTSLELDDLTVRGTMNVYELLVHQIRATNGSIFVSSTAKIASVSGTDPNFTLTTDGETAHGFLINDVIRAQRFTGSGTYQCNLTVTAVTDLYTFTATRVSGVVPRVGMEFVRLGNTTNTSRQGTIYLTADDSGAPFIDVINGVAAHSQWNTAGKMKVRIGKLDGLSLPTPNTDEYGLWAGTGVTDASQYIRVSNKGVLLNNVPIKLFNSGTQTVNIDAAGTDIWIGPSNLDKKLIWNGSTFTINALLYVQDASRLDGAVTLGTSGGIYQGTGTFATPTTGLKIWNSSGQGQIALYAGGTKQIALDATNGIDIQIGTNDYNGISWRPTIGTGTAVASLMAANVSSGNYGINMGADSNNASKYTRVTMTAYNSGVANSTAYVWLYSKGGSFANSEVAVAADKFTYNTYDVWHTGTLPYPAKTNTTNTFSGNQTITGRLIADGVDIDAAEYIAVGAYERFWRPNQQIAATNQGSYGPTLTYNAQYSSGWKSIAGGAPTAMGITEGKFWFATAGSVGGANAALTWTNRLTITSTDANFTGNVIASADISAGGALSASGATTLSSTLGVTGAATLSSSLSVASTATFGSTIGLTKNTGTSELGKFIDIGLWRGDDGASAPARPGVGYVRLFLRYKASTLQKQTELVARFPYSGDIILATGTDSA